MNRWRLCSLAVVAITLSLSLAACSGGKTATVAPTTAAPTMVAPTTVAPTTAAPTTVAPTATPTQAPTATATPPPTATATPPPTATPTSTAPPTPPGQARTIEFIIANNTFPKELRVKVGEKIILHVSNKSSDVQHSVDFSQDERNSLTFFKKVNSGDTQDFEWVVPNEKGSWKMGCFFTDPNEVHDGMVGTLIIE